MNSPFQLLSNLFSSVWIHSCLTVRWLLTASLRHSSLSLLQIHTDVTGPSSSTAVGGLACLFLTGRPGSSRGALPLPCPGDGWIGADRRTRTHTRTLVPVSICVSVSGCYKWYARGNSSGSSLISQGHPVFFSCISKSLLQR